MVNAEHTIADKLDPLCFICIEQKDSNNFNMCWQLSIKCLKILEKLKQARL